MRFWFTNDEVESLDDAGEVGGHYQVRLPSYQLDRATFDEEVLRRSCVAGAKLLRPVSVTKVELNPGGEQTVTFRNGEVTETVRARWIVDASGVAALLARKEGWWRRNTEHPTAAAWSRWKGVISAGPMHAVHLSADNSPKNGTFRGLLAAIGQMKIVV